MTDMARHLVVSIVAILALFASQAWAQEEQRESLQIGLSTDRIAITSDFSGADLTIFGALDNADPLIQRQGHYDIIVVLEGPAKFTTVRRKDRFFGIWINRASASFTNIPSSYSLASSRKLQDITADKSYQQLSLGPDFLFFPPAEENADKAIIDEFSTALRELKKKTGLYSERVGAVQFLSQNLFRATVNLPANVSLGTHRARAFLFKNGTFIAETSSPLIIVKSGIEEMIHGFAQDFGVFYGIFAVLLAVMTGWAGRIVFRKD